MKYNTILIDPPWNFKTYSDKGQKKSASQHYNIMTLEDICDFPIGKYASDDCALFMWATWPNIFEVKIVLDAWGFQYSGLAWEWIKYNNDTEKFSFGGGYGTRKNVEPCILARKGNPRRLDARCRDFIMDRRREHSRKPDIQYERIERLFKGPYLEIFARQQWPGWDSFGNEVEKYNCKAGAA